MSDRELALYLMKNAKSLSNGKVYIEVQYQGTSKVVRAFERAILTFYIKKFFFFKETIEEEKLVLGFDIIITGDGTTVKSIQSVDTMNSIMRLINIKE